MSWIAALLVTLASGVLMALVGTGDSASQSPDPVPASAESARADATRTQFPGGDTVPAILVVTRTDGAGSPPADVAATDAARARMLTAANVPGDAAQVVVSTDGKAAIATVPLRGDLSGFALNDAVKALREAASDGLPGELRAEVTGGPAFGADIANSFAGANFTLLAVTATVVALLLIVTYRSPVLWLVPLLVIAFADRVAPYSARRSPPPSAPAPTDRRPASPASWCSARAPTTRCCSSPAIARSLASHHDDHRAALRTAVRHAGPAIIASNATVVLALLTLLLASSPSTRSLGVQAATGLVVAAVFVLVVLPPLLALFGKRLFWPFVPSVGAPPLTTTGVWHRVASAVARRPGRIAGVAVLALALLCTGLLGTSIGLSQTEQFRVKAESVTGYRTLAAHFPSGLTDPTRVVGPTDRASELDARHHRHARCGVLSRNRPFPIGFDPVVGGARRRAGLG